MGRWKIVAFVAVCVMGMCVATPTCANSQDDLDGLVGWLRSDAVGGWVSDAVRLVPLADSDSVDDVAGGHGAPGAGGCMMGARGVVAGRGIAAGESLVMVPFRAMVPAEVAYQVPIGRLVYRAELSDHEALSCLVAQMASERRHGLVSTAMAAYVDTLPTRGDLSGVPVTWSADRAESLGGSLTARVDFARGRIAHVLATVFGKAKKLLRARVTRQDVVWATAITMSRGFAVTMPQGDTRALVPLADMFNTAPLGAATNVVERLEPDGLLLVAGTDIAEGEELLAPYGVADLGVLSRWFFYGIVPSPGDVSGSCEAWWGAQGTLVFPDCTLNTEIVHEDNWEAMREAICLEWCALATPVLPPDAAVSAVRHAQLRGLSKAIALIDAGHLGGSAEHGSCACPSSSRHGDREL